MNHPNDNQNEPRHGDDNVLDHTRRQLSALVDGELAPDEARFLLRRLEHDAELSGCWERWQLAGELMRGRGGAVLPAEFAGRVAVAVASEAAPAAGPSVRPRRWLHWGGGAIAASAALVALLLARPAGEPPPASPPALASNAPSTAAPVTRAVADPAPRRPAPPTPAAPDTAAQLATAVAAAEVPRRAAAARRGNAQAQRAATRLRERRETPVVVVANAPVESARVAGSHNPFSPEHVLPPSRPWPRALVPGVGGEGGLTVEYGGQAASPGFYPFAPGVFQPRRGLAPAQDAPQAASAEGDTP